MRNNEKVWKGEIKRILQSESVYLNHSDFDVWVYIWVYTGKLSI
jgi:hypothetical protein